MWLPASMLALATVAYASATRNTQVSLARMWHGYEQAEHNERLATVGQAELRRVLKVRPLAWLRLIIPPLFSVGGCYPSPHRRVSDHTRWLPPRFPVLEWRLRTNNPQ